MNAREARASVQALEHTGDMALGFTAPDLARLLEVAALGLSDVLVDAARVAPHETRRLELEEPDRELLLVRLLREVLYAFDAERWVVAEVEVAVHEPAGGGASLAARLGGEPLDPVRHEPRTGVKAITYHGLRIEPDRGGLRARVVLDL